MGRFIVLSAIAALSAFCSRAAKPPAAVENILLVTIDTLRADRVGVYGGSVATPNLDRLAREGAWAARADAPAPMTRPSHASIFTGRSPAEHGIHDNVSAPLSADVPVLAEAVSRAGFTTAAFVTSPVLERQSGLARGFSYYSDRFEPNAVRKPGDVAVTEALQWWADKHKFFAWVHLYDLHAPYEPPSAYAAKYPGRLYDGCVAWSDELVGRLIDGLRAGGALDRTLVIVTSDHGESLGEHGEDWHGFFVYEATLHVPLIVRGPGVKAGTRIDQIVRLTDLFPTVVELTGVAGAPATSGRSLASALRGQRLSDAPAVGESLIPRLHFGWSDLHSIRDGRWKYIAAPRPELYDLDADPAEQHDLAGADAARAQSMRAALNDRMQRDRAGMPAGSAPMSAEARQKLGALGYFSGSAAPSSSGPLADPKDKISDYREATSLMSQGLTALNSGRAAEAVAPLQSLERRRLATYDVHYYLGQTYAALGRPRDAAMEYQQTVDAMPAYDAAWRGLGESRAQLRDWPAASRAFERLVALAPTDALARMQLGDTYGQQRRFPDAIKMFREAIAIDPKPDYWNVLGAALGSSNQMTDAERAFAEAVSREPGSADYLYNHAIVLLKLSRRDEAIGELRRAADLGSPAAKAKLGERGRTP